MNNYRVALILCRAVTIALWWHMASRLLTAVVLFILASFGISGMGGGVGTSQAIQSLITVIPLALAAGFLQIFAPSLATSIVGQGAFEGDSIASRVALQPSERALGNAGGGLFLLFYGAASGMASVLFGINTIFSGGSISGSVSSLLFVYTLVGFVTAILQCLVGFVLTFSLGLRRLIKAQ